MNKIDLRIAETGISVTSDLPGKDLGPQPAYLNFVGKSEGADISVHVHANGVKEMKFVQAERVFRSGIMWDVYRRGGNIVFCLTSPISNGEPYAAGAFLPDFREGNVYGFSSEPPSTVGVDPLPYPILRLLMTSYLSLEGGMIVHGCGISDRGEGILFCGSSGAGKSTMARIWENDAEVLSDERVIIRKLGGAYWLFGTPWMGDYPNCSSQGVPLKKVFFLHHAQANAARAMRPTQYAAALYQRSFLPYWLPDGMGRILGLASKIAVEVPGYNLGFLPTHEIVEFIRCVK